MHLVDLPIPSVAPVTIAHEPNVLGLTPSFNRGAKKNERIPFKICKHNFAPIMQDTTPPKIAKQFLFLSKKFKANAADILPLIHLASNGEVMNFAQHQSL